mmetsp:Transcript_610/g.1439  ORF Transcript_610/g.1439 Transcript_610/m.1439 type:complete len:146 (+) Transcript_610:231-668(+)
MHTTAPQHCLREIAAARLPRCCGLSPKGALARPSDEAEAKPKPEISQRSALASLPTGYGGCPSPSAGWLRSASQAPRIARSSTAEAYPRRPSPVQPWVGSKGFLRWEAVQYHCPVTSTAGNIAPGMPHAFAGSEFVVGLAIYVDS